MVSDTPSSKNDKKNDATAEDTAPEGPTGPLPPKTDDAAVETAMADVAAAIKRHEEHQDKEISQAASLGDEERADGETVDEKADSPPPPEPPASSPPLRKGPGFGPVLLAGVAGAVIALAGAYTLSSAGMLGGGVGGKINDEIASLRQELATLKANDGSSELQSQLDALKQQVQSSKGSGEDIASLKQQVSSIQSTQQNDVGAVKNLQSAFNDLKSSLSSDQQAIQQKLSALEAKVNTPGKDLAVARAIAAAALKSAIDRGDSFATELATYAEVAPENADLSKLKALATSGIPTREELADEFSDAADAIIAAAEPPPPEGNIFNRLVDSAKGLVSVRPVGDVEGDTVPAIVARIENALSKGDLKTAESEWETLPDAAKQASQKFADGLKARIEADDLVSTTLSSALGATAGAPVTPSGN
ncbi:COG4223 family protein [Martelella sp. FOR1707]